MADTKWSKYFNVVYGALPSGGYPICTLSMYYIWPDALSKAGIQKSAKSHPSTIGDYYKKGQEFGGAIYMIYHGKGAQKPFQSNRWVEGAHCRTGGETASAWYWYTPGSGIWIWSGTTKAYSHREEHWEDVLGVTHCRDFQCGGSLFTTSKSKFGYDTVQYTEETNGNAFMWVVCMGQGRYTCGTSTTQWKSGWAGSSSCSCNQNDKCQNCAGVGFGLSSSAPCSSLVV